MSNFKNFETQLLNAVRLAQLNTKMDAKSISADKEKLKGGITIGQYDLVKRVYISTIKTIKFRNGKK